MYVCISGQQTTMIISFYVKQMWNEAITDGLYIGGLGGLGVRAMIAKQRQWGMARDHLQGSGKKKSDPPPYQQHCLTD